MSTEQTPIPRMSAAARREQVLAAATRAFARSGYAGTSTDAVAREAGVSQPYVVRMFGTKRDLFVAVFDRAARRVQDAFAEVLAGYVERRFDPADDEDWAALGAAYTDLLADRDFMLVLMHGFTAGDDEAIGARGRTCMSEIYELLLTSGCTSEQATDFIAHGMLLNVMLAMRAPEHLQESRALNDMVGCAFGEEGLAAARGLGS